MAARKKSNAMTCPACSGQGQNLKNGQPCGACNGSGQMAGEFPFPYSLPINLTVTQVVPGVTPALTVPGAPANVFQSGINPVTLRLPTDGPFKWVFTLINATSPTVVGDASRWLQVKLTDLSGGEWPFMSAPIFANLFAGDAQLPFPQLEPLEFGEKTNLQLEGYPVNYPGTILEFGVGAGAPLVAFAGVLNGPVLPGSVVISRPPGIVAGQDDGNGVIATVPAGVGIVGTINYTTGVIDVKYAVAPAAGDLITATYTQGCARIDAQVVLNGQYLRPFTDAEKAQIAQR